MAWMFRLSLLVFLACVTAREFRTDRAGNEYIRCMSYDNASSTNPRLIRCFKIKTKYPSCFFEISFPKSKFKQYCAEDKGGCEEECNLKFDDGNRGKCCCYSDRCNDNISNIIEKFSEKHGNDTSNYHDPLLKKY
ncbi:unnamed protein product [Caenorhabditis brenneri]